MSRSADESSRLECTTNQYDQVVALSEQMITEQLKTYSEWLPEMNKISQFNYVVGSIDAEMKPPRVSIPHGQGTNLTKILFHLCFKKGTMEYRTKDLKFVTTKKDADEAWAKADLADWEWVFLVDLDLQSVPASERAGVNKLLNVAGDYSIQRLMLKFGTADTSRPDLEHSKVVWPQDATQKEQMNAALSYWMKTFLIPYGQAENRLRGFEIDATGEKNEINCTVLYHALAKDPEKVNPIAPRFPPTAVCHQTYNFQRTKNAASVPQGDTRRNCLLYLEMCDKKTSLPRNVFYGDTCNFVTWDKGTDDILGTMCLSSKILVESFLLEYLKPLVKLAELTVVGADAANGTFTYAFGQNPQHMQPEDDYFTMKRQNGTDTIYDRWFNNHVGRLKNLKGWRWVNEFQMKESSAGNKTISLQGQSIVNLTYEAGTNRMVLSGCTTINVSPKTESDTHEMAITGHWSVKLAFTTGTLGRLKIDVNWAKSRDNGLVEYSEWYRKNGRDMFGGGSRGGASRYPGASAFMKQLEDDLDGNIKKLDGYINDLRNILSQHTFILAGAGYFMFKNPIFANNGDLLVELKYNGITPDIGKDQLINREKDLRNGSVGASPLDPGIGEAGVTKTVTLNL